MKNHLSLLQINLQLQDFRFAILCFVTAFVVALVTIPPIIALIRRYRLFDLPNARKEHSLPIPTMGGVAIMAGLMTALFLWFPFNGSAGQLAFFFSLSVLFALGIMDDLKDLSARYKFLVQLSLATLIAAAGIRINTFGGFMGVYELPLVSQYTLTIVAITGITNAFNLIDGIDGLAGGLGFMSLLTLGLFLTLNGDADTALVAFALAGAVMAFLYFNLNPARIFMGDTGSLVLGFAIAVLGIRLLQVNAANPLPALPHAPVFVLAVVLIPVFDTVRVFTVRIWKGQSPFVADRSHIHHILTNAGFSHAFAAKLICAIHGFILMEVYWLRRVQQEWILLILVLIMCATVITLGNLGRLRATRREWNASKQGN
jgi:UDP-N-acetylmuramyl pentapeptide phosphotransferase/UDP-N-acetylglucosamine-1-phosphate transferase